MTRESELLRIASYYDEINEQYDAETAAVGWQSVNLQLGAVLSSGQTPSPASHYLDIGSGTGQTIEACIAHHLVDDSSDITAVDISPKMLARLAGKNLHPRLATVQTDFGHYLAESKKHFDAITAVGCLEFVPAQKIAFILGAMATRLERDGIMVMTYRPHEQGAELTTGKDRTQHFWPSELVEAALAKNGIALYHSSDFTAYNVQSDPNRPVVYRMLAGKKPS